MSLFYYNDQATGASANGNLSDAANWWNDSAWTIPAGQIPTSADNVEIDWYAGSGTLNCNNLDFGPNGCADNSTDITVFGTITYNGFSGAFFDGQTFFIGGQYTPLDGTGTGDWNGLFYYQGSPLSGGYFGTWFTNGISNSSFTGQGYDNGDQLEANYINGVYADTNNSSVYGFFGQLYDSFYANNTVTNSGLFPDYGNDPTGQTQYCFYNGVYLTGGYDGTHYINGVADSFTGFDYDYSYNSPMGYINGIVDTGDIYLGSSPIPVNYPAPSDVRSGITYGLRIAPQTGTLVTTGGGGINLGQLIGLPAFIQL